jgi:hypothetical protein
MSSQQHFQGFKGNLPVIKIIFFKTLVPVTANNPPVIKNRSKTSPYIFGKVARRE